MDRFFQLTKKAVLACSACFWFGMVFLLPVCYVWEDVERSIRAERWNQLHPGETLWVRAGALHTLMSNTTALVAHSLLNIFQGEYSEN